MTQMTTMTSWGRVLHLPHTVVAPGWVDELPKLVKAAKKPLLGSGLRRSYGDSAINSGGTLVDMQGVDRILFFDENKGILRAEAGASLYDLISVITRKDWFFATCPGTRFVTLGGAVAHDVHGKNHHSAGSFGCHVRKLGLVTTDGKVHELEPKDELFKATVGGMGLTGIITWVEVKLVAIPSVRLVVERIPFTNLDQFWNLAEHSPQEHTVSWLDATDPNGRGIFERADWIGAGGNVLPKERAKTFPFTPPITPLNWLSVGIFNWLYFRKKRHGPKVETLVQFLYPLDGILHWNRMYGPDGFYQHQCVLPKKTMKTYLPEMLEVVAASGQCSFLTTLKTLGGKHSVGMMSFPMEGCTLALDFPNRGQETLELLRKLDAIVLKAGGRIYAAKDGWSTREMFAAGYPRLEEFRNFVDGGMDSRLWQRVGKEK